MLLACNDPGILGSWTFLRLGGDEEDEGSESPLGEGGECWIV